MPRQRLTEPEVASDLKETLNRYIEQGGLPFDRASVERKVEGRRPDIVIWTDYEARRAFALWELKAPGERSKENLAAVLEKALNLNVRYVLLWDFRSGDLYEVEDGQLQHRRSYPTDLLCSLEEWIDPSKRRQVENQAKRILDDLAQLARGESLTPYVPDKIYFTSILQDAIHQLVPSLKERIFKAKASRNIRQELDRWAVEQGYRTDPADMDMDAMLARHWAYSLAVRILFYFTIRRYYSALPDLCPMPESAQPLSERLWSAFSSAQAVDWQAVFEQSPLDRLGLPLEAERTLESLLDRFHRYDFSLLKEDVIGQIMEGLIPPEERHALGQYFTREDLVDFILGFVADDPEKSYLDPTCGSGTFLNRLYSRLRWRSQYRASHAHLLERLWGVDIAHFPAELATINLFRQDVRDVNNFPRILVRDFFRIQPQQTFEFPPPQATALDYRKVRIPMPRFHGIVGNFPYIRQELIEDKSPGYKQTIVQTIAREWFWKDPYLFKIRGINNRILEKVLQEGPAQHQGWLDQQVQKGRVDLRLSGQADIYAYLFYHAAAFLEEGGRLGIVTSNAWLDVAYGAELKRFFLRHFKIVAVVASWCEPWFEDADINTAFVILERCEDAAERARNVVRFVKVKKPLADLLPGDLLLRENDRWRTVDALVREIETADAQIAAWDPITGQVQPLHGVHTVETGNLRIRLVPQAELERELESRGETAKWGLYIRAPQVYFDLLEKAGDRLVPLNEVAEVRRGYTTGINEFFYLKPLRPGSEPGTVLVENERKKNAPKWVGEIEEECLQPVIRSPKESPAPSIDPNRLRYRLFLPPYINQIAEEMVEAFREELKNKKLKREDRRRREREFYEQLRKTLEQELQNMYPLAYAYVRWGESQRTSDGRLWPEVPSVQGRRIWWLMPDKRPGPILMPMINDRRFVIFDNEQGVFVDHNLFEFLVSDEQAELCVALMNSTIFALVREVISRVNLGEGATKTEGVDWNYNALLPNPSSIDSQKAKHIIRAYRSLQHRPVGAIAEEIRQKDRRALDRAVLEALGLDPEEYLPQIYQGLEEMVRERLALPEMRTTRKQQVRRMSLNQIKEKVRQEVLPGGLKSIAAYLPTHPKPETRAVPLTGRPVQWRFFLNQYTFIDPEGNEVGEWIGEEVQARYVLYAWKPGHYRVEVPVDPIVAGKAVQQYEQDLRRTADEIFQRLLEATQDYRQATRATEEILESLGLPLLAVARAMGDR